MRFYRKHKRIRRAARSATLCLCALAYFAATFGFPVEIAAVKPADKPFPCQHHRCGCQSAEACEKHCCCFTRAERQAWYRKNSMALPVELAINSDAKTDQTAAKCCSHHSRPKIDSQQPAEGTEPILAVNAQRCQGLVTFWITAGAVLPLTPAPVTVSAALPVAWQATTDSHLISALLSPPDPPPRLAIA